MNDGLVNAFTEETTIKITGLVPYTKYYVTVKTENKLYDADNTTHRSVNISVKSLEGGINLFLHSTKYAAVC